MLEYDEIRLETEGLRPQIKELETAMNMEQLKKEAAELEEQSTKPDFWNDAENSQKIMQKIGALKNKINSFNKLKEGFDDVLTMIELANEEEDASMLPEIKELAEAVKSELEEQKLITLLSGEYDSKNAILTFHAGAGGTEAQDWVEMLYRMYNRWAERHNFKVELLDYLDGEEAGIKSASLLIKGENSYGFLKLSLELWLYFANTSKVSITLFQASSFFRSTSPALTLSMKASCSSAPPRIPVNTWLRK